MELSGRQKLRQAIMFKTENWPWWTDVIISPVACLILGHYPIGDQCGKPDHDYCAWCMKSMPGKAEMK